VVLFWILACNLIIAQPVVHPWHVTDSGGGKSTGGTLTLRASIGQAAVQPMSVGGANLESGYIPGVRFLSGAATALQVGAADSWNMVSVPLIVSDSHTTALYPSAISNAFSYGAGYTTQVVLQNGVGYWLKFGSATVNNFTGTSIGLDSIPVATGWNMIGGISYPVLRSDIVPVGTALISPFFGFAASYQVSDTLYPGQAYWIKVNQSGRLVLKTGSVLAVPQISGGRVSAARSTPGTDVSRRIQKELSSLSIRDSSGTIQTLYYTHTSPKGLDQTMYVLPPLPPQGVFDVRYVTQRSLEIADRKGEREIQILVSSAVYPVTIWWKSGRALDQGALVIDGRSIPMKAPGELQVSNPESIIRLRLSASTSAELPKVFLLHQNFPNPFNPTTTIRYDLPSDAYVTLRIYSALGQLVRTLVDETQGAGFKSVAWNSANEAGLPVATGVYFYRLVAAGAASRGQTFTQVKKTLLVR